MIVMVLHPEDSESSRTDNMHFTVAAYQHYLICQILLVAHNPRTPRLGPRRAEAAIINDVSA